MQEQRERERERDEAQRRMDVDMAQRNFERERMEQARIPYNQTVWRQGPGGRMQEDAIPFTAQCLINAIITENISRPPEPRDRFVSNIMYHPNGSNLRPDPSWLQANRSDPLGRIQNAENNGNSHSPNIINVDVDSTDLSRHSQSSSLPPKNIKLNDITDAVISKDPSFGSHHPGAYHPHGQHFVRYSNANSMPSKNPPTQSHAPSGQQQPQLMGQDQIIATDQWKHNRRMQQQQQKEEMAKSGNGGGNPQGRSTPDDRHIIRMAQSPSPRSKYEPVSPPDANSQYYFQGKPMITINPNDQRKMPLGAVPTSQENAPVGDANMVLKFVNHKIAEAMRNNDEKYGSIVSNEHHAGDVKDGHVMKGYERPRSGSSIPGNGIHDNESDKSSVGKRESPSVYISQSSRPSPQPNQSFQPTSMAFMPYPYSALTIPQAGANPIISPKAASELIDPSRQSSAPQQHLETRQVMSEQYDALSDED